MCRSNQQWQRQDAFEFVRDNSWGVSREYFRENWSRRYNGTARYLTWMLQLTKRGNYVRCAMRNLDKLYVSRKLFLYESPIAPCFVDPIYAHFTQCDIGYFQLYVSAIIGSRWWHIWRCWQRIFFANVQKLFILGTCDLLYIQLD